MVIFNIIAGIASIFSLIISLIAFNRVNNIDAKINSGNITIQNVKKGDGNTQIGGSFNGK